jgi:1,4-dihydroxy-2-naphthoate octaprenyltransferase
MSKPGVLQAWVGAARPKTLAAGAAPVLVGTALAAADGHRSILPALACLAGSLLIQVGCNFANDYFDHKKGADTPDRIGPARAVAQGWIQPRQMALATGLSLGLAFCVGMYLIALGGWPILAIGLASLLCAVAYTGGPMPLAYVGLGDLFVLLFFGLAAVVGTYWVQASQAPVQVWVAGLAMGLLATAILVVNNLRDRHTDAAADKRTLAVRLGPAAARWEFTLLQIGAFASIGGLVLLGQAGPGWMLSWLALPLAIQEIRAIWITDGPALNPHLGRAARVELIFGLLLGAGALI